MASPPIAEALRQGVDLHKRGQLDDAERLYRQVLQSDAHNGDAWHLLGLVAHARGDADVAVEQISRAIEIDPRQPSFHNHLAEVYRGQGRLAEAEQSCRTALALKEDFALAHNTLGLVLNQPGRLEEAADSFRRAIALAPTLAMAHYNLGLALQALGRLQEAVDSFRRALSFEPQLAAAHCDLGQALEKLGHSALAAQCYRRALGSNPNLTEAHCHLGSLLQKEGSTQAAIECYQNALACQPDCAVAHYNLGLIHQEQYDFARAAECYARAIQFDARFPAALNNLGNVLKVQGRIAEADTCYEQAAGIDPNYAQARFSQAMSLMAKGDLAAGWPLFEWRWECPEFSRRTFDVPSWQGEPLDGRRLLVYAEQGLGDTLQFVRLVPPLAQRGGRLILEVPRPLVRLLEQSGLHEVAQLVAKGNPLPSFDATVSLVSLAGILGVTLDAIPTSGGYLSADPQLVTHWRAVLGDAPSYKVGIAWQGNREYLGDRFRSIPLAQFEPLALEGVELVSLQKGFGAEQLADVGFRVRDLAAGLDETHGPFMDTAAVMKNLDLVVTSDTVTAHLAGALGVPVWVALPLVPDWRWMYDRSDSPWYASMQLFRQTRFDDWPSVFQRIAQALLRLVGAP